MPERKLVFTLGVCILIYGLSTGYLGYWDEPAYKGFVLCFIWVRIGIGIALAAVTGVLFVRAAPEAIQLSALSVALGSVSGAFMELLYFQLEDKRSLSLGWLLLHSFFVYGVIVLAVYLRRSIGKSAAAEKSKAVHA